MAKAAEDSVWWASVQTYLGVFGAIAVVCSLWFTGWAAVAAGRAAKAADASVGVASNTAKRQLRAYVSGADSILEKFEIGERPLARITMKNNGQTPAYVTRSSVAFELVTAPLTDFEIEVIDHQSSSTIGPGCTFHPNILLPEALTQTHMDEFFSGKKELWFFGKITYRDAFGDDRETNFRFFLLAENARRWNFAWSVAPEGNDAT